MRKKIIGSDTTQRTHTHRHETGVFYFFGLTLLAAQGPRNATQRHACNAIRIRANGGFLLITDILAGFAIFHTGGGPRT